MVIETLLLGLGWVANAAAGGIVEGAADERFRGVLRDLRERLPSLLTQPDGADLARGMRRAQLRALQRLVGDFEEVGPHAPLADLTGPDPFIERATAFCRESLRSIPTLSPHPGDSLASDAAGIALLTPTGGSETVEEGLGAIEQSVLAELRAALDGVAEPTAFEPHFRRGGRGRQPYVALFATYVAEEIKENEAFREVLNARLHLQTLSAVMGASRLADQIATHFGVALERIEDGVAEVGSAVGEVRAVQTTHGEKLDDLLRMMSAERGVPFAVLHQILARLGELDVPPERIVERLDAWAGEYLDLREKWSQVQDVTPDVAEVKANALALIETGDFNGARLLFSDARAKLRAARQDRARQEATFLSAEAEVDRLELRYRDAIERFIEAESLVSAFDPAAAFDYEWERVTTLKRLGEEFGDNSALEKSIAGWKRLLEASPRTSKRVRWAAIQNNLGNALTILGERESGTARLEEAIAAYRAALQERPRERLPLDWATTQNNLGTALMRLGERERGTGRLEEAIATYRAALEERTRERVPLGWAKTQINLGNALTRLGERASGTACLEEAVVAYEAALEECSRKLVPLDWAMAQNNLGNVLKKLGDRESGTSRLEQAVVAYRAALEERTRERVPLSWAATQNNLGNALFARGERESGTAVLMEAVLAYRAALEERTRDRVPLDWAAIQNNLGSALTILGERADGTAWLEEGVAAYRAALEEWTRERVPLDWAATQNNLGNALAALGERESGTTRLEEAVTAYRAALEEWTRERVPLNWATAQNNLGSVLTCLGEREIGTARLAEAIAAYRSALEEQTREGIPLDWAMTQHNLGNALAALGERETGSTRLEEAIAALQAARVVFTEAQADHLASVTERRLGLVLRLVEERKGSETES